MIHIRREQDHTFRGDEEKCEHFGLDGTILELIVDSFNGDFWTVFLNSLDFLLNYFCDKIEAVLRLFHAMGVQVILGLEILRFDRFIICSIDDVLWLVFSDDLFRRVFDKTCFLPNFVAEVPNIFRYDSPQLKALLFWLFNLLTASKSACFIHN